MVSGTIVAINAFTGPKAGFPWWNDTDAVLVQDRLGFFVYGEIRTNLNVGDIVEAGQQIGSMIPVLLAGKERPDIAGHSTTMLHLERYNNTYRPNDAMDWSAWDELRNRPHYLEDPTSYVVAAAIVKGVNRWLT